MECPREAGIAPLLVSQQKNSSSNLKVRPAVKGQPMWVHGSGSRASKSDDYLHSRQSMEKLGQKDFSGHECYICFYSGYQKSAGLDSETPWDLQSGKIQRSKHGKEGQGASAIRETQWSCPEIHCRSSSAHRAWDTFWKTESSFRHQSCRSRHLAIFTVFISPNILHNDCNEHL